MLKLEPKEHVQVGEEAAQHTRHLHGSFFQEGEECMVNVGSLNIQGLPTTFLAG
jgi:hypothetical protein